jgi:hypothetical protein
MDIINYKFVDYINEETKNIALSIKTTNISDKKHYIFYGKSGIGKYSTALSFIKEYSPSGLKYEKKVFVNVNKQDICIKLSDIHYEIDFDIFHCNTRLLWNTVYDTITNMIINNPHRYTRMFILCKNFHYIHNELLEIFHSYIHNGVNTSMILLTEQISFIPSNILSKCEIISMKSPNLICDENNCIGVEEKLQIEKEPIITKRKRKVTKKQPLLLSFHDIPNLYNKYVNGVYNLKHTLGNDEIDLYTKVCMSLIYDMELYVKSKKNVTERNMGKMLLALREKLYNIFIYHLDFEGCMWIILFYFIENGIITVNNYDMVILHTVDCYHYMNNNYREIFHAERWILSIIKLLT